MDANGTLNAYMQPTTTTLMKSSSGGAVPIGGCRDSATPPSPTSWHILTACPNTIVSSSPNAALQRPLMANNAVATLPDIQKERKSFASRMSGLLFTQKPCKDQGHCDSREFSPPPAPASMILLPAGAASPTATTATSKQRVFADHNQPSLEPQPAYSDGSNTYYVINIDRRGTTATPALPSKGALLHPHPEQSFLTPGPDSSYV